MTDYKTIRGKKIKFFSTDLDNAQAEGQIFYSDTDNEFKTAISSAAWHSSGALLTARARTAAGGTQTAGLVFGGNNSPPTFNNTEEYNGSGFASGGNLNTARGALAGCGTQTAGLGFGGTPPTTNITEEYNGTAWTESGDLNTSRQDLAGAGTQTAGLGFGGRPPATGVTEEYNGTSWTESGDLNTARDRLAGCGTQTAAIAFGGGDQGDSTGAAAEQYDGSSWTTVNSLNTPRGSIRAAGIQTSALGFGGEPPGTGSAHTESWNGTSWATTSSMATNRARHAGFGTHPAAVAAGQGPPYIATTEEFTTSVNVITAAAFSAGGDQNTYSFGRNWASAGPSSATYTNGGYNYLNITEEYNGTSWSEDGDSSNNRYFGVGAGTLTAGVAFGGYLPGTGATNVTEEYNGSSWTSGGNMNVSAGSRVGGGTQTAAIAAGGTGPIVATEYYDGSSWTTQPATMNETHRERNGVGTQTSLVAMGGTNPAETVFYTDVEEWDGSTWTSLTDMVEASKNAAGIIGQNADGAIYCGGQNDNPATNIDNSQVFNGTTVVTGVSPAYTARGGNQGAGTTSAGLISGRYSPGNSKTEHFTPESTALNLKTITDS